MPELGHFKRSSATPDHLVDLGLFPSDFVSPHRFYTGTLESTARKRHTLQPAVFLRPSPRTNIVNLMADLGPPSSLVWTSSQCIDNSRPPEGAETEHIRARDIRSRRQHYASPGCSAPSRPQGTYSYRICPYRLFTSHSRYCYGRPCPTLAL